MRQPVSPTRGANPHGRLPAGRAAAHAIVAAARVLDGALTRTEESEALAGWAAGALDRLAESRDVSRSFDALLASGMLALARTGRVAPRPDLRVRLDALGDARSGGVALWADACDVFADDEYRRRALDARLPRRPVHRVFALLRRHQITGDARWVADAFTALERAAATGADPADLALIVAELCAPERVLAPPFNRPSSTVRRRHEMPGRAIRRHPAGPAF